MSALVQLHRALGSSGRVAGALLALKLVTDVVRLVWW